MAGLGAMLIGMIGGGVAMLCIILMTILDAVIIFVDAHRHGMNAVAWLIMALLFNLYSLPFYIFARIKTSTLKCSSCRTKVNHKDNFCPVCGSTVAKFDDGAFAEKVMKIVLMTVAVFIGVSVIFLLVTGMLGS